MDSRVCQGYVIPFTLFNTWNGCWPGLWGWAAMGLKKMINLDFADDAVIFAEPVDTLIGALETLRDKSVCLNLCVLDQDSDL